MGAASIWSMLICGLTLRTASRARAAGVPATTTTSLATAEVLASAPGLAATAGELDWAQAERLMAPSRTSREGFMRVPGDWRESGSTRDHGARFRRLSHGGDRLPAQSRSQRPPANAAIHESPSGRG